MRPLSCRTVGRAGSSGRFARLAGMRDKPTRTRTGGRKRGRARRTGAGRGVPGRGARGAASASPPCSGAARWVLPAGLLPFPRGEGLTAPSAAFARPEPAPPLRTKSRRRLRWTRSESRELSRIAASAGLLLRDGAPRESEGGFWSWRPPRPPHPMKGRGIDTRSEQVCADAPRAESCAGCARSPALRASPPPLAPDLPRKPNKSVRADWGPFPGLDKSEARQSRGIPGRGGGGWGMVNIAGTSAPG